ncbi:monooxygenase, partial [Oleoguttula sp. CCFEE 5521]
PAISEYIIKDRTVVFADGSREQYVDTVLYCTGYFYSFDFLEGLDDEPVVSSGERVENLYQHLFYRPNPSLIFPTLNQKIIPFPFAEAQAAVIARVLAGRLCLPSSADMKQWEEVTMAEMGAGRDFHVLKFPKDADYINAMHDWAMNARENAAQSFGDTGNVISPAMAAKGSPAVNQQPAPGKQPPYWTEREYRIRERFRAIKKAFQDFGDARHGKRTLADVGFVFDE